MRVSERMENVIFILFLMILLFVSSAFVIPDRYQVYDVSAVYKTASQLEEERENSLDVLFAGDSLVYTSVSPLQMYHEQGFASYNCGTASQRICDSYTLIQNAFDHQNLKLVVLDISNLTRPLGIYEEEDPALTVLNRIFPVFHYHLFYKLFSSPKELLFPTEKKMSYGYMYKGYSPKGGVRSYKGKSSDERKKETMISGDALSYLQKIQDLCNAHDCALLLMNIPSPLNWNADCHDQVMNLIGDDFTYMDLNEYVKDIGIDWSKDTFDRGDHLNTAGAKKVSAYLGSYIKDHYSVSDHRNDPSYEEWDRLYEKAYSGAAGEALASHT